VEIVAEDPGRVTRAPSDALRLATAVVTTAVVVVVGLVFGNAVVAFTSDLLRGLDAFPSWLVTTIVVLAQLASVAIVAGVVLTAIRLRSGLLVATTVRSPPGSAPCSRPRARP
jgi:hypothetical protein